MPFVPHRGASERSRPVLTFGRKNQLFLFLVLSTTILCCNGFTLLQPSLSSGSFSTRRRIKLSTSVPLLSIRTVRRQVSHVPISQKMDDDDTEETTPAKDDDLDDSSPEDKAPPPGKKEPSEFKKGLQRAGLTLSFTWSYLNIALGALLSVGLLLNILGYGYALTDHGIVIDTLGNMREDQQFHKAVIESMKDVQQ
jgi:hypothetical protein